MRAWDSSAQNTYRKVSKSFFGLENPVSKEFLQIFAQGRFQLLSADLLSVEDR
jgi:hypothetical protein